MRFLLHLFISLFILNVLALSAQAKEKALRTDWPYVEKKLKASGFDKKFITDLKKHYEPKHFEMVVKLNVLLFLVTADYHGVQVTEEGVQKVRFFLAKNEKVFQQAEKDYGVSRNIIASLLWMETRHGQNQGVFHVASSFVHLLQADREDVKAFLQKKAPEYNQKVTAQQRKEIIARTKKKADWALQELKAVATLYKKDRKLAMNLRGSFSGAFGMPQFLPSSYQHWAKASKKGNVADLYKPSDAICSVGNYLKQHGWRWNKNTTHVKSLMKYNNSRDYAEAILKLAEKSKVPTSPLKRIPASKKKRNLPVSKKKQ